MSVRDIEELKERAICWGCVGEGFLKNEIRNKGEQRKCSYCGSEDQTWLIDEIADEVERAFEDHYERTASEPDSIQYAAMKDKESSYDWSREGEQTVYAIMNAADIPEEAAEDIQAVLEDRSADFDAAATGEETEFDSDAYYAEKAANDAEWRKEWQNFEVSLRSQARFFNQPGAQHLASLFQDIDTLKTREKRQVVVDAGPGTLITGFYRARVFHDPGKLEEALTDPANHIGPPPSALARPGRMNAHGISVFYGAEKPAVALAEVRPPVGSWAIVARFDIIRPLRLLDLAALVNIVTTGSVFDPEFKSRLGRARFLHSLSERMTLPVMPDDEPFEYLVTQAVADFLATDSRTSVDGILFPSVQVAGSAGNVVLFHKASAVEPIALPEGTKVTAHSGFGTEDGWEFDFGVWEEVPEPGCAKAMALPKGFEHLANFDGLPPWSRPAKLSRPHTLRIDLNAVTVHEIKAVAFETTKYPVLRRRMTKIKDIF